MKKIAILLSALLLISCNEEKEQKNSQNDQNLETKQVQEASTKSGEITPDPEYKTKSLVTIKTNLGVMKVKLYPEKAPVTVESFNKLIDKKYYDGIIFHRVIENFMIQGGDPTGTGTAGESAFGRDFQDEFDPSLKFDRKGLLAMANAGPGTNGSQFFITLVETPWLNNRHTIFGEVVEGMDVLEKIGKVKTNDRDRPLKDVVMESVTAE